MEDEYFKTFIPVSLIKTASIEVLTNEQIQKFVEDRSGRKVDGEQLKLVGQVVGE